MKTSFESLAQAHTIIFASPLLTLTASICDLLERAGIPAALCREKGSPAVVVPQRFAAETRLLLDLAWPGLS